MTMRKQCAGVAKQTYSVLGETVIPCYIKRAQRQVQLFTQRYFVQYLSVFLRLKQVKTMLLPWLFSYVKFYCQSISRHILNSEADESVKF